MKLALDNITAGFASVAALNANFDAIETAIENTLSRDGTIPNYMNADLDMNNYRILNCADILTSGNLIAKGDWVALTCYVKGDLVNVDEQTFIAVDDYCASAVFADDAAHWQELFISFTYNTSVGSGGSGVVALPDPSTGDGSGWVYYTDGLTSSWVQASSVIDGSTPTFSVYNLVATGGETTITLPFHYTVGGRSLSVMVNGLVQYPTYDYIEDTTVTFTFLSALVTGDKVRVIANIITSQYVPEDPVLAALYALTPANNKLPYFTGATSAALIDLSAFVRGTFSSADAVAFRTAIGAAVSGSYSTLGVSQTWQDVSASRSGGTTYQNTSGAPIQVVLSVSGTNTFQVSVNNSTWVYLMSGNYDCSFIIPNNYYYKVNGTPTISKWVELR